MRSTILSLLPAILPALILAACGGGQRPAPAATATLIPTLTVPTPTPAPPLALLGGELLGAPGVLGACDHPPEAEMSCRDESARPVLEVNANASTYARWRLQWGETQTPLTGDETLALRLRAAGSLAPNLYLVERSGARIGVPLARFGLRAEQADGGVGAQTVHVPLREIRNAEGATPDFGEATELQVVFEWADMAGTLTLESVRFLPVWEEPVSLPEEARTLAAALTVPAGFSVTPLAGGLREMTQIEFTPDGEMLVSLQGGRIWWYSDGDGDGVYDRRRLYATGFEELVGLLYDPLEGAVWAGGRGRLARLLDSDGNGAADRRELRIDGLPWGRHQNNGLTWNPIPDPFSGEPAYHWIYFGLGSTDDLAVGGELNATVLRFPRTGQGIADLEVVSRGNRNAYDLIWAPIPVDLDRPDGERVWQLFASENGPDFNDAPDEVNHIRWGHHYGFPEQFGPVEEAAEGAPYSSPVYPVTPHASADGIAYVDHPDWPVEYRTLYVSLFGEVFSPTPVGHMVERVMLRAVTAPDGEITYRGEPSPFITGLDRPLPLTTHPDGNLVVGDYATGVVYRIHYSGMVD